MIKYKYDLEFGKFSNRAFLVIMNQFLIRIRVWSYETPIIPKSNYSITMEQAY